MDMKAVRRQNLLKLMTWAGSDAALARLAGTAPAYISHIKTGKRDVGGDLAARIEAAIHLAPGAMSRPDGLDELLTAHGLAAHEPDAPKFARRETHDPDLVYVRRSTARVAAGNGEPAPEVEWSDAEPQPYRRELLRSLSAEPDRLAVVVASGDSMEPRIFDGDLVLVNTGDRDISDGHVFVVWYADACRVKRLYRTPTHAVLIRSDNQARYPDILVDREHTQNVRVIGRVIYVSGREGL